MCTQCLYKIRKFQKLGSVRVFLASLPSKLLNLVTTCLKHPCPFPYPETEQDSKMKHFRSEGPSNTDECVDFVEKFCFNTLRVANWDGLGTIWNSEGHLHACTRLQYAPIAPIKSKKSRNWALFVCFWPPCLLNSKIWSQHASNILAPFHSHSVAKQDSIMEHVRFEGPPNRDQFVDFIQRFCFNTARVDVAFPQMIQK